jgi:nonsense-mediated mRNA decay protein 3
MQLVALDYEAHVNKGGSVPDVLLVRKSYEEKRRKRREKGLPERTWKLKHLDMDVEDPAAGDRGGRQVVWAARAVMNQAVVIE